MSISGVPHRSVPGLPPRAARARSASSVASGSRSPKRQFQVPRAVDGQPVAAGEAHQRSFVGDRSSVTRRRDRQDNCLIRAIVRVWCQWAAALFDAKAAKVRKVHKEAASCAAREAHSIPSRRSLRSFAAFASNNLAARSLYRPHRGAVVQAINLGSVQPLTATSAPSPERAG